MVDRFWDLITAFSKLRKWKRYILGVWGRLPYVEYRGRLLRSENCGTTEIKKSCLGVAAIRRYLGKITDASGWYMLNLYSPSIASNVSFSGKSQRQSLT